LTDLDQKHRFVGLPETRIRQPRKLGTVRGKKGVEGFWQWTPEKFHTTHARAEVKLSSEEFENSQVSTEPVFA
jgi:hypothetical protein